MKLASDDFELFGVPRRFEQDRAQLDARWRALQAEVHPDRTITFRLSAPKANEVTVAVNGLPAERLTRMEKDEKGMWSEPSVGFGSTPARLSRTATSCGRSPTPWRPSTATWRRAAIATVF